MLPEMKRYLFNESVWIPAFAGMTKTKRKILKNKILEKRTDLTANKLERIKVTENGSLPWNKPIAL